MHVAYLKRTHCACRSPGTGLLLLLITSFTLAVQPVLADEGGSYSVQIYDAFKITGRGTVVAGRVKSGSVTVGDTLCIPLTSGDTQARTVEGIERFRKLMEQADEGQHAGFLVGELEAQLVAKGEVMTGDCEVSEPVPEKAADAA